MRRANSRRNPVKSRLSLIVDNVDNKWVKRDWTSYGNHEKSKKTCYHGALNQVD